MDCYREAYEESTVFSDVTLGAKAESIRLDGRDGGAY
jgi:hypothetical protein